MKIQCHSLFKILRRKGHKKREEKKKRHRGAKQKRLEVNMQMPSKDTESRVYWHAFKISNSKFNQRFRKPFPVP
jgi:hypothetical protein